MRCLGMSQIPPTQTGRTTGLALVAALRFARCPRRSPVSPAHRRERNQNARRDDTAPAVARRQTRHRTRRTVGGKAFPRAFGSMPAQPELDWRCGAVPQPLFLGGHNENQSVRRIGCCRVRWIWGYHIWPSGRLPAAWLHGQFVIIGCRMPLYHLAFGQFIGRRYPWDSLLFRPQRSQRSSGYYGLKRKAQAGSLRDRYGQWASRQH